MGPAGDGLRRSLLGALCWALLGLLGASAGCGDAHWDTLRWPDARPGAPRQPELDAELQAILDLALRATRIDYEPEAIVVSLALENRGEVALGIERAAILLAWDALEYPVTPPGTHANEPAWIRLGPGEAAELRLRYRLGRPLTGPGAKLVFRSLTRGDAAVVALPELELPAMPAG